MGLEARSAGLQQGARRRGRSRRPPALFQTMLGRIYEKASAVAIGEAVEITAVIDPAETRSWIARGLATRSIRPLRVGRRRPVDVGDGNARWWPVLPGLARPRQMGAAGAAIRLHMRTRV